MNYGEAFRMIRRARGFALEGLADESVSKSTISRFERGEAEITLPKLVHLTGKLNISMREFLFLAEEDTVTHSMELLSDAVQREDVDLLEELITRESENWKQNGNYTSRLTAIVLNTHLCQLKRTEKPQSDIELLTDYLFSCEVWTQFDVVLFGNSMAFLPDETAIVLSRELVRKTEMFRRHRPSFETLLNILFNISILCLDQNRLKDANEFITIMNRLEIDDTFVLERILRIFVRGLYAVKAGNTKQGTELAEDALQALELAGSLNMSRALRELYTVWPEQQKPSDG